MKTKSKHHDRLGLGLLLIAGLVTTTTLIQAEGNPGIAPANSKPLGMSYGQWGAAWWQWAFSLPASDPLHPLLTTDTVDCSYGQHGKVWFLAGTLIGGTRTGSCTVPTGTRLFVPVLNAWVDNVAVSTPLSVQELAQQAASLTEASELHASVDGMFVRDLFSYRAASAPFGYTVPATDNLLRFFGADAPGKDWPTTFVFPAASDGYWLMLEPLSPGIHIINFGGTTKTGFQIDLTYTITVLPKGKS